MTRLCPSFSTMAMAMAMAMLTILRPSTAFTISPTSISSIKSSSSSWSSTSLHMALTPIGPFCPFRSKSALDLEPHMEPLNPATSTTPDFATELARIQLDMQMNVTPEPQRLQSVAKNINIAVDQWESLLTRMAISDDFQTREYSKLTTAHLSKHGQSSKEIISMMRWQSDCMMAMSENRPPPFPPSDLDIMKLMQDAKAAAEGKDGGKTAAPNMAAMRAAEQITSTPFKGDESAFESETVKEEYEALCRDHNSLIEFGHSYGTFDPMGKLAYLDQVESIEERWEVFFARFQLLGQLNDTFVRQCNQFLESMNLDEGEFRELLRDAHQLMRDDAERERNNLP